MAAKYKQVRKSGHGLKTFGEHVVIAEKALGHKLPTGAEVHHLNGNGLDNTHENLVICENQAYHHLLHYRQRVLAAGFNPDTHQKCAGCKQYKQFSCFVRNRHRKTTGYHNTCKECARIAMKDYCKRNPDKVREWTKRKIAKDPERHKALRKANWLKQRAKDPVAWRLKQAERQRRYRERQRASTHPHPREVTP